MGQTLLWLPPGKIVAGRGVERVGIVGGIAGMGKRAGWMRWRCVCAQRGMQAEVVSE